MIQHLCIESCYFFGGHAKLHRISWKNQNQKQDKTKTPPVHSVLNNKEKVWYTVYSGKHTYHHIEIAHCLVKVHIPVGREVLYAQDFSTSDHRHVSLPPTCTTVVIQITRKRKGILKAFIFITWQMSKYYSKQVAEVKAASETPKCSNFFFFLSLDYMELPVYWVHASYLTATGNFITWTWIWFAWWSIISTEDTSVVGVL